MLSVRTRQTYLKALGMYKGAIDGIAGPKTKTAYKTLQNKYFTRKQDRDGIYGNNTDILLQSAYNCRDSKYFKLSEFRCKCGGSCTGYPAVISSKLISILDALRAYYGKPITITSGVRCAAYNKRVGGVSNSTHKKGRAADIYIPGVTNTAANRKKVVSKAYALGAAYSYANTAQMGNAVHINV